MYFFGDGFDLYAATADAYVGATYWDSGTGASFNLVAGRFSGSRAIQYGGTAAYLTKSSGVNDSVHHFCVAFQQTQAVSGSTLGFYILLLDGTTNQCAVVFRSDGAILLTSGGPAGTVLATYTGAVAASSTWYGFEIEVIVHNSTGSFKVRKNGNTSDDFSLTGLDTAGGTANNYANKVSIGSQSAVAGSTFDDFLWRSDAASVPWVGDVRCYTRMPVTDAAVQWTPSGAVVPMANFPGGGNSAQAIAGIPRYLPFTPPCDGTVATLSLTTVTAVTATIKCAIFDGSTGVPTTVLGSANLVTNPGVGTTTFTFATPVAVARGVQYYAGFVESANSGTFSYATSTPPGGYAPFSQNGGTYAGFPSANPTALTAGISLVVNINITPTAAVNAPMVADAMQDAAVTYVSSATVGQTDLYGIAPIAATPASVLGVVTRALAQKTDAGTRNIAVVVKSGATTSAGTSTALNTSFGWVSRVDLVDIATGVAWTPTSVNNLTVGPTVTA